MRRCYTTSSRHYKYHGSHSSPSTGGYRSLGLRREDKSRWERRAPLTPAAVQRLIDETGTQVYVQPSTKRIFTDSEYQKAGAIVTEDLSSADIILGIKEVPTESLLKDKTYVFFSHTHKGTPSNMPMLQNILDKKIRLIDYELMKDGHKRLVAFGEFAGKAGMIDTLHGMGHRFLGMGHSTPFMYQGMAHTYPSLASAKLSVSQLGNLIEDQGTPSSFGPLVFAFTGDGNVAHGAMDIFKELPHEMVAPEDLAKLVKDKNPRLNKVYGTHLDVHHYMEKAGGKPMENYDEYLHKPELFHSRFHDKIAPFVNTVVTGAYWDKRYPRLLTNEQLREIQLKQQQGQILPGKMMALGDIVCDIRGAFECLSHSTSIDNGFFYYDAIKDVEHQNPEGPGIQVMGIDILPAELPQDSSQFFSEKLYPHLKEMIQPGKSPREWSPTLRNSIIAEDGKLTAEHQDLTRQLPAQKKKVLVLGSGMVAGPLVDHLTRRKDVHMVVASNMLPEAQKLTASHDNAEAIALDIADNNQLQACIEQADVIVSFVPAFLHTKVADICISKRKPMVTASYVSPEMQALEQRAKDAGVVIMNEVGLDPGIDHMSAMKIIDECKQQGKKVRSFVSWCGGLPAPDASNVPLGYKFSWSPRGVLTASGNDAVYWANGKEISISGDDLLKNHFPRVETAYRGFVFEGLANRNALGYADIYGLGSLDQMDTMFRGTLRYQGYSDLLYAFKKLGFLEMKTPLDLKTWAQYFDYMVPRVPLGQALATNHQGIIDQVAEALAFLRKGTDAMAFPADQKLAALDLFSVLLTKQLSYAPGERDMCAMHHEFGIEDVNGNRETLTSTLVQFGEENGTTSMAKTVGLPAAMATELVLDGRIQEPGVHRPVQPHVYLPILEQLEDLGVRFVEQSKPYVAANLEATGSGIW
ncbi:Saccharopine dehydrogenase-domain-containing protein [Gongronella butleri]|nr:Saccharopine dehydrogenase-domain-containing protein [Gongronella butleri]